MYAALSFRRVFFAVCLLMLAAAWPWSPVAARPLSGHVAPWRQHLPPVPHGRQWRVVPSPTPGTEGYLYGTSILSASDAWAVGNYTTNTGNILTLIERWNGTRFKVVSSPSVPKTANYLSAVAALSTNDAWAVGHTGSTSGTQTLTEHWNGTKWQIVPSPNVGVYNYLFGVAAVSQHDVWAVGRLDTQNSFVGTLIEHWNGTSWQVLKSPNPSNYNELYGVSVVSATDVWAVGIYDIIRQDGAAIAQTLTEHWNGFSWQIVPSPNDALLTGPISNILNGVTAVSSSDIWGVGGLYDPSSGNAGLLIEHWNGTNWQIVTNITQNPSSTGFGAVAAANAKDSVAVGSYYNSKNNHIETLTEQWNGTRWKVVGSRNPGTYNLLHAAAAVPTGQVMAVGEYSANSGPSQTLAEFYS